MPSEANRGHQRPSEAISLPTPISSASSARPRRRAMNSMPSAWCGARAARSPSGRRSRTALRPLAWRPEVAGARVAAARIGRGICTRVSRQCDGAPLSEPSTASYALNEYAATMTPASRLALPSRRSRSSGGRATTATESRSCCTWECAREQRTANAVGDSSESVTVIGDTAACEAEGAAFAAACDAGAPKPGGSLRGTLAGFEPTDASLDGTG